jgi:dTDP-glucose 4,6-dehydratase
MTLDIVVIGSNSFSGNAFEAHTLLSRDCLSVSRSTKLDNVFEAKNTETDSHNPHIVWNLNENSDFVIDAIRENGISTVVNFAAQSMVGESWNFPQDWYEANVVSFAKFVNRLKNETNITKFIHFTTPEVYGSTDGWIKESFNFAPNTPYAISRAAGDWHLRAMYENFDFPVIFTRAANVYGEHQQLYRIVPKVILSALTGKKLPLQGGGKSIRSFIHISDINRALDKIISKGHIGETYHISTNELITIHDLVALICGRLNVEFSDVVEIAPDRPGKDFAYQLDSSKIRSELNWADSISLTEGIDNTISWVKANLSELREMPTHYIHRK